MKWLAGASARKDYEQFVLEITAGLLRTGYLMTWDLSEAENLVQETLLRAAMRWPTIRGMEYRQAYVRRILVNLVLDGSIQRSRNRAEISHVQGPPIDLLADLDGDAQLLQIETRSEILCMLADLPLRQRAVIVLRYFEDLSEADIASTLGWPIGTVKSTASRALEHLQRVVTEGKRTGHPVVNE
jgi:RNA polymerase sigma-70 factor (sigma-E family)